MLTNDSLYQDATVFDQLLAWGRQQLARRMPANRDQRWQSFLNAFSMMLTATSLMLLVIAFQQTSQPAFMAHLLSLALVGAAALHFRSIASRIVIADAAQPEPASLASQPPVSTPANPRQFFKGVKAAGVNMKIARALYSGGIHNAEILNSRSDAALLAIHGVGPATVRKLRVHFNFVENYYEV